MQHNRPSLLFALFAWSAVILRWGYHYGTGDQVELLPYTLFLHDHSLYPHDFFIQGLNAVVPNERTVMATLMLPFVNHLEVFCFLFYGISTVVLIMGMEKIALRFIANRYFAWLAVLLTLIPLNDYTLGNVDLTPDTFQAGTLCVAIVVWAINWFLDGRFLRAALLMSIATLIQLLDGLDVMMVLSALMLLAVFEKKVSIKQFAGFLGVFAFTAGGYLVYILKQKNISIGADPNGGLTNEEFFQILFVFRHPHHFIFSAFPALKKLVFFICAFAGLLFFSTRSTTMFRFILIGLLGVIVYAFVTDNYHLIFIGNFQFYKVAQWLKFFGVIAIVEWLRLALSSLNNIQLGKAERPLLFGGALVCWGIIFFFRTALPYHVPYQLFALKQEDDMISICQQIKEHTPKDAVFIQPFDNTELKFYGQRSSFVEFKANVRHRSFVKEWYTRVNRIYGVSVQDNKSGFKLQQEADSNFYAPLTINKLLSLKNAGITHLLTKKDFECPGGILILSNNTYAVYKL